MVLCSELSYDEQGKRIQHWERGFSTQKEAKKAYDEYMNNHSTSDIKKNSTMSFKEFKDMKYVFIAFRIWLKS